MAGVELGVVLARLEEVRVEGEVVDDGLGRRLAVFVGLEDGPDSDAGVGGPELGSCTAGEGKELRLILDLREEDAGQEEIRDLLRALAMLGGRMDVRI